MVASYGATDDQHPDSTGSHDSGMPLYTSVLAMIASLNSVNYGFDCGVSAGAALYIRDEFHLNDSQIGLFFATVALSSIGGGFVSFFISDKLGRRCTFLVAQALALLGIASTIEAQNFTLLLLGRVLVGLSVGVGMSVDPMYISEIAPAKNRGELTTWAELGTNIGIMLGYASNVIFGRWEPPSAWRAMVGIGYVTPALLICLVLCYLPESPRWLVAHGRDDEALAILSRTHPEGENVSKIVHSIKRSFDTDEQGIITSLRALVNPVPGDGFVICFALFLAVAQQANGQEAILFYAPTIFEQSGIAPDRDSQFKLTFVMGFVKITAILVAAMLLDRVGRRPLLVTSGFVLTGSLTLIAVGSGWQGHEVAAVMGVMLFVTAFSIGVGPICWLFACELFPPNARAVGMSLAVTLNRVTAAIVNYSFLPLIGALGSQSAYFQLMTVITLALSMCIWCAAPETMLENLEHMVERRRSSVLSHPL